MTVTILGNNVILLDKSQEFKEQLINNLALAISALRRGVVTRTLTTPPTTPASESLYLVATGATGTWAGKDNQLAQYYLGTLSFYAPFEGLTLWLQDEEKWLYYKNGAWSVSATVGSGLINPMTAIGDLIVGGASGAATRFAVGTDGTSPIADSTQALGIRWGSNSAWIDEVPQITTFTPVSGHRYPIDTTGGAFGVTLPSTGTFWFYDCKANSTTTGWALNNFTITVPTGYTLANLTTPVDMNQANGSAVVSLDKGTTNFSFINGRG